MIIALHKKEQEPLRKMAASAGENRERSMRQVLVFLVLGGVAACNNQDLPVGKRPHSVGATDLNGDARPDLFVANEDSDDISVLFNIDGRTFEPELRLKAGDGPVSIVSGDFDEDGNDDLAAVNFSGGFAGDISLFLNQGNGNFDEEVRIAVGLGPVFIVTDDFDGDGNLDLVTADSNSFALSFLSGNGNGTFDAPEEILLGGLGVLEESPKSITVADVDGDGLNDLLVSLNFAHKVGVLLNQDNGNFAEVVKFSSGSFPTSIAASDFDADGLLDLGVANSGSGDALVFLQGLAPGVFNESFQFDDDIILAGVNPVFVLAADMDEDGQDDLVAANSNSFDVTVSLGQGDGTFVLEDPIAGDILTGTPTGDGPNSLVIIDFDQDNNLDVATSNSFTNDVTVLFGQGNGQFDEQ
jgi:hypothetical protein